MMNFATRGLASTGRSHGLKWIVLCLCLWMSMPSGMARTKMLFDSDWLFILGDAREMAEKNYDDTAWRRLDLPHDWAIEGDFFSANPSGAGGGALPGGIGWYRKHFDIERKDRDRCFLLSFDGIYMNSTVYVNGKEVGRRPYGYSSMEYDITPYVTQGNNVVAVRVDNSDQPNSRWYSGCGIYRHVWLTTAHAVRVDHWGTQVITTPQGGVTVNLKYVSHDIRNHDLVLLHTIYDEHKRVVARSKGKGTSQRLKVRNPKLWDIHAPHIYTVKSEILLDGKVVDEVETTTGFRDFRFDTSGFWLNGRNVKLNGVCDHHDLGCLGAAFNEDAMHRKLLKFKQMGVNALRCTHNPPAPEVLNMCDTMGIVVIDESFDMWRRKKTRNDYARYFDEWHERDLADMVLRDRNHPSVLVWSIGNEVLEQWSSADADELTLEQANLILNAGHKVEKSADTHPNALLTQHLAQIVRRLDNTRPITAGCNEPDPNNHLFKSGAIDLIGFNYHHQWMKDVPEKFPGKPFYMSESVSALQTRGFYPQQGDTILMMPERWDKAYTDPTMMCSAYDNQHVPWGCTHEQSLDAVKHTPYCFGQFIWTGFDYLGEPTPYGFPARSSYFGVIDLAGFPKDVYYMYQSEWTEKPVLHLFPHWNWLPGQTVDMWCYYSQADEVELYINGNSQGVRRKTGPGTEAHRYGLPLTIDSMATEFHVNWRVKFVPGEVTVVARKNGKVVGSKTISTAGAPDHIRLTVDYDGKKYNGTMPRGGKDLVFVNAEVVDKDGNLCPHAENQIFFDVKGGSIEGVDNGCQYSMERFKANRRRAFFGKCMVVVSPGSTRNVVLSAKGIDLKPSEIDLYDYK